MLGSNRGVRLSRRTGSARSTRPVRLLIIVGLVSLALSQSFAQSRSATAPSPTRQVTDITGRAVTIPSLVTRVADPWHANNGLVLMMGAARKIVATTLQAKKQPWFR